MSNPAAQKDIGHFVRVIAAAPPTLAYASGSYSATGSVSGTGFVIDRQDQPRWYNSVKACMAARADLTTGWTITATYRLAHCSASGGTYANLSTGSATLVNATTATSVIVEKDCGLSVNLSAAKRFLKFKFTHQGSATATGSTVWINPVLVFGGADQTPATATSA